MFSTKLAAALTLLVAAASSVSAAAAAQPLGVITPKAGDVWKIGSTQTITWDTSSLPAGDSTVAPIFLGFLNDGSSDEHLDVDHPLATNVPLAAGKVSVTVPAVTPGDNYIVSLFGSGNISPEFTITN
ncbi:hypothetical protein C8Q77DRAFT_1066517 [Trametes polyzona]|nr:hypothetical protein C8Q77DRAFT_1066517 [Trametes polyzona]